MLFLLPLKRKVKLVKLHTIVSRRYADTHHRAKFRYGLTRRCYTPFANFDVVIFDVFNNIVTLGVERTQKQLLHIGDHLTAFFSVAVYSPRSATADRRALAHRIFLASTNFKQPCLVIVGTHEIIMWGIQSEALH